MIAREHRFHGYNSLRYVYQHGRTVRGPLMALKLVMNPRRQGYRLAVVVSKKVHKSAVTRNRIRRRLYEAVRQHEAEITKPYDLVLTVFHEQVATMPADELQRMTRAQLRQAGVIEKTKPEKSPATHTENHPS
jgi:ribonuclease P protein component